MQLSFPSTFCKTFCTFLLYTFCIHLLYVFCTPSAHSVHVWTLHKPYCALTPITAREQYLTLGLAPDRAVRSFTHWAGRQKARAALASATRLMSESDRASFAAYDVRTFSLLGEKRDEFVFSRPLRALRAA